jgi:hypothetical protein
MHRTLKEKRMQEQPTGYGPTPQWYGQQQSVTQGDQWNQQNHAPYPPIQEFAPQQPFPPHHGQFKQPLAPSPQWNQQSSFQSHESIKPPQKKSNTVKYFVFGFVALIGIIFLIFVAAAITSNSGSTPSSTLSEPDYKANAVHTTVGDLNKESNQDKGVDVYFNCTILSFVKDSNGNTVGANVDNELSSGVIQVIFPSGTDLSQINTGDNLDVWGQDEGSFSGTNVFGVIIQEVAVGALYMTDDTTGYQTA